MLGYQVEHQPSDFVVAIVNAGIWQTPIAEYLQRVRNK